MSINTKLVLLLTLTVGAIMLAASFVSLKKREAALETALRDELKAHAVTLQIALEENYQSGRISEAQRIIDRLRENSKVYGVILFDEKGEIISISQSLSSSDELRQPPELGDVLRTQNAVEFIRKVENHKFLSVIRPLKLAAEKNGAVEIVKPLELIEKDIAQARINWLATTLLLLAMIFLVVYVVLRRNLSRPITKLLYGARTIGRGDLEHRVSVGTSGDELAKLAFEFNRMADNLAEQRESAQREAENRLNLEKKLRHSERLAAVGRLAAGIAHELGAPLNVIDARAEQLLEKTDVPREKQIKNLTLIRTNSARITHIVRQLLNLARPYHLRFEKIELKSAVNAALEGFSENENVRIEISAPENLQIFADADYLQQVLVNIFRNAFQAMKNEGVLRIEIFETELGGRKFAAVKFSDTGEGIASENLEKVFDPFYTTKDIGKGTGLGLAVSRRIVEEHEGFIEAENNADGGADFTVYLPANEKL